MKQPSKESSRQIDKLGEKSIGLRLFGLEELGFLDEYQPRGHRREMVNNDGFNEIQERLDALRQVRRSIPLRDEQQGVRRETSTDWRDRRQTATSSI